MEKGLELEFWVIDGDGNLDTAAPIVEEVERCEPEFVDPLLEIKTPPRDSMEEIREATEDILTEALETAKKQEKGLVPLGTTLTPEEIPRLSYPRGDIQARVLGERISYAKNVAGTHIHFDQEEVVPQLNLLTALDPALALTNSSPYYGDRLASGARTLIYRQRCYEEFPQHGQLWQYTESREEWERRQEKRFEEFRDAALTHNIDSRTFSSIFEPGDTIWTPVRLREEFGTVEWRAPDTTLPSQTLKLVEDVSRLVEQTGEKEVAVEEKAGKTRDKISVPPFDALKTLSAHAVHQGLYASDVVDYLEELGFDVGEYLPVSGRIGDEDRIRGKGARRTRKVWAKKLEEDLKSL
ncbi:MAG: glutamate-cysteine ligase family protein [Candidatus Nanohaloarchaea archaeon]|nr:glutamate-cysteine ligase family protein [Candidatus Nanohaloarchaea archaeon]